MVDSAVDMGTTKSVWMEEGVLNSLSNSNGDPHSARISSASESESTPSWWHMVNNTAFLCWSRSWSLSDFSRGSFVSLFSLARRLRRRSRQFGDLDIDHFENQLHLLDFFVQRLESSIRQRRSLAQGEIELGESLAPALVEVDNVRLIPIAVAFFLNMVQEGKKKLI